jgi:hypothetical protein
MEADADWHVREYHHATEALVHRLVAAVVKPLSRGLISWLWMSPCLWR